MNAAAAPPTAAAAAAVVPVHLGGYCRHQRSLGKLAMAQLPAACAAHQHEHATPPMDTGVGDIHTEARGR